MTKNRSSEIYRKSVGEKEKLGKFSTESANFVGNSGEIWNRGKCVIASREMDAPGCFNRHVYAIHRYV